MFWSDIWQDSGVFFGKLLKVLAAYLKYELVRFPFVKHYCNVFASHNFKYWEASLNNFLLWVKFEYKVEKIEKNDCIWC